MTPPLFPREHGAYGQIALPLATVLWAGSLTAPALALSLAVVMGFLAHEPLMVLGGARGARARRDEGRRAAIWLTATGAIGVGAAAAGVRSMPEAARWFLLVPLLPAILLAAASALGQEKSVTGEVAAALAFAGSAVPVGMAAGLPAASAVSVGAVFGSIFVGATLGVRGVILTVRAGGRPRAASATRLATVLFSIAAAGALLAGSVRGPLATATTAAAAPGLIAALALAAAPPSPTRLRTVGWTLVATSVSAAIILIAGLG